MGVENNGLTELKATAAAAAAAALYGSYGIHYASLLVKRISV